MKWICLLMFGSVGLTTFVAGVVWGAKRLSLLREGTRTTGTVVEINTSDSTDGRRTSRAYYPLVEFVADGQKHRFQGSTGSGSAEYQTGSKVDVIYNKANPSVAQIADFEQFWLGPLCLGLFGFLFLAGGIGGFFLIADSDKTFGPAFEQTMARAELYERKKGIPLQASVREVKTTPNGKTPLYTLICRGGAAGGAPRDFESAPLAFDPGSGVVGKPVTVYMDPTDPERYFVLVDPLFGVNTPKPEGSF